MSRYAEEFHGFTSALPRPRPVFALQRRAHRNPNQAHPLQRPCIRDLHCGRAVRTVEPDGSTLIWARHHAPPDPAARTLNPDFNHPAHQQDTPIATPGGASNQRAAGDDRTWLPGPGQPSTAGQQGHMPVLHKFAYTRFILAPIRGSTANGGTVACNESQP